METPLLRLRKSRNLTAAEVARAVGCHKAHLGRIEKAEVRASSHLAAKIAAYMGSGVTEVEILYPERFQNAPTPRAPNPVRPQLAKAS